MSTREQESAGPAARRGIRTFPTIAALALAFFGLMPAAAFAQSAFAGVVRDASGGVLPGVTVEAASPALIEKVRTVVTDDQGRYNIVDVRPGTYALTFSLAGFTTFKRDGIVLPSAFTATVNAELSVGTIEETVTVSGEAPIVDAKNVAQTAVLSKEMLDATPAGRLPQSYTTFIPGVAMADGGVLSANTPNTNRPNELSLHGSRGTEHNVEIDGFPTRSMTGAGGNSFYYYANTGTFQEIVVSTGGSGADQQMAGLVTNAIPKEGGNSFSGSMFLAYTDQGFVGDNLTDQLIAQGVSGTNSIRHQWDVNPVVGGPILRDKLWFLASYRHTGSEADKGVRYNLTPDKWVYTPDTSRPTASEEVIDRNHSLRLTWQATQKNKFGGYFDYQPKNWYDNGASPLVSPEASGYTVMEPNYFGQFVWKSPITNKILLEAGTSYQFGNFQTHLNVKDQATHEPASPIIDDAVSATEQTTNMRIRARNSSGTTPASSLRTKGAVSFVSGVHSLKIGADLLQGSRTSNSYVNGDYTVTLNGGLPRQLTLFAPSNATNKVTADLGVYAQDQWSLKKLTLNLGLRYDYFNGQVPPQDVPANRWLPARHYDQLDGVPHWHDLSPRVGAVYDLFGNGKTAIKASLNRYVVGYGADIVGLLNPVATSVSSANRTWTDSNGNFIPECDFSNSAVNGECGVLSNLLFGSQNPRATRYDPDVLNGYAKRQYNWETIAGVQQEITHGISINTSYFRRTYGNFWATDNQAVTPADFDSYCITVPTDPFFPGGGGNQLCGFYDLNPSKVGQVINMVTFANKFGAQSEVFNGVDVNVTARLAHGLQLSGGTSTGRTETNTCFVVDSPSTQVPTPFTSTSWAPQFCNIKPPLLTQFKMLGLYPLPWWGVQVSGVFQSVNGTDLSTTDYVATNAQIVPSLGRNLSAGANATVTLPLLQPGTQYADRWNKLDIRVAKLFRLGPTRILGSLDVYNLLNSSDAQLYNTRYGSDWLKPTAVLGARTFKLNAQVDF